MSLNILKFYDKEYLAQLGTEYVCTGFMYELSEDAPELAEQLASFDFVGVISDDDLDYHMGPTSGYKK